MARKTAAIPPMTMPAIVLPAMGWAVLGDVALSGVVVGDSVDEKRVEGSETPTKSVADNAVIEGAGVAVDEEDCDAVAHPVKFPIFLVLDLFFSFLTSACCPRCRRFRR